MENREFFFQKSDHYCNMDGLEWVKSIEKSKRHKIFLDSLTIIQLYTEENFEQKIRELKNCTQIPKINSK